MLLNHAASGLPPINDDVVRGVIEVRARNGYAFLISGLGEIAMQLLKPPISVIVHGYDYPVPDGRGVLGASDSCPDPGFSPGFNAKASATSNANTAVVGTLIDTFNAMLRQLARSDGFEHVRYVDLRGTLSHAAGYKHDWATELHPTKSGFSAVANKIAAAV